MFPVSYTITHSNKKSAIRHTSNFLSIYQGQLSLPCLPVGADILFHHTRKAFMKYRRQLTIPNAN